MAGTAKVELLASLLQNSSHQVEVVSQGEVVDNALRFYPMIAERERFHPQVPVSYASSVPIRGLNMLWSDHATCRTFLALHRNAPFDLVIIYNLKSPQIACANHALRHLGLPVILEYEDDRFVDVTGHANAGWGTRRNATAAAKLLPAISGAIAASPYLMSTLPSGIPKLLLRGAVRADIFKAEREMRGQKLNRVFFSGTHIESNGVAELIEAWPQADLHGWELHVTGFGHLTDRLRRQASGVPGVVFHGLVDREALVRLMCSAKICINPHQVSRTPGNVFAFKIVEYLAAGGHVVTTPMGSLEPELEAGVTYMPDNKPATIAATLQRVVKERLHEAEAALSVQGLYGPQAVTEALNVLIQSVCRGRR